MSDIKIDIGGWLFSLFIIVLTTIFVIAKIWGPFQVWSWWIVFMPIWIWFAIAIIVGVILLIVVCIVMLCQKKHKRFKY